MAILFALVIVGAVFLFSTANIKKMWDESNSETQRITFNKLKSDMSSLATYTYSGKVLSVQERDYKFNDAITIEKLKHADIAYEPEKYVYTGVSVGGVTTGGFHKEGDYHYISNLENTGRYQFMYCGEDVSEIELTDKLLKQAKKSNISKYIKDGKIIIFDSTATEKIPEPLFKQVAAGSLSAINLATRYLSPGYPTYEKCVEIKNWLCNNG